MIDFSRTIIGFALMQFLNLFVLKFDKTDYNAWRYNYFILITSLATEGNLENTKGSCPGMIKSVLLTIFFIRFRFLEYAFGSMVMGIGSRLVIL